MGEVVGSVGFVWGSRAGLGGRGTDLFSLGWRAGTGLLVGLFGLFFRSGRRGWRGEAGIGEICSTRTCGWAGRKTVRGWEETKCFLWILVNEIDSIGKMRLLAVLAITSVSGVWAANRAVRSFGDYRLPSPRDRRIRIAMHQAIREWKNSPAKRPHPLLLQQTTANMKH
jgi:hypothetical protein